MAQCNNEDIEIVLCGTNNQKKIIKNACVQNIFVYRG